MTAHFGDAALRWAGLAAQLLGWRPAEFWSATPAELATALTPHDDPTALPPPSREAIARMMERDADD
ncbi:phage tail assembly chaperone [Erythrobacter sp. CCH5-A1]|jgi:hypothetical protein|uniref:phage tail assembly chaperone n=1 Tax=Erythrobacter sp. CCH5-A1 TaxID=1768792 RepID=UPI00082B718A|nr:phage tail assembly chaperone [Erythrobacter sp. CCH5-A1]